MKKLALAVIGFILLYCAYWFIASRQIESRFSEKLAAQTGYDISHAPIKISGFPLAFNSKLGPFSITARAPKSASATAQNLSLSGKAYMPLSWVARHHGPASLSIPMGDSLWSYDTQTETAIIDAGVSALGGLSRLNVTASAIAVTPTSERALPVRSIEKLLYDFRLKGKNAAYTFDAKALAFDPDALGQYGRAFGNQIEQAKGTMAVSDYGLANAHYTSEDFTLTWGPAQFGGGFDLTASAAGHSGVIDLIVADEAALLQTLVDGGIIGAFEAMGASLVISGMPKDERGRHLKLTVIDSRVSLGPVPLGKLPF
ncbi:MAG: DUF2125 domain-containing protein [Robiginitomaculum sp.]